MDDQFAHGALNPGS